MDTIPALAIKGIFDIVKHIYDDIKTSKKSKYTQREIERAYQDRLNQLNDKEKELLNGKKELDKKIKDMEKQINEQRNPLEKLKLEREKICLEQKQKEEQKKIQEIQEKQKAINQSKKYLSEKFILCVINSFNEYKIKEKNWIEQITKNDIENRKKEFYYLFQKLFVFENIQNKITNKFIEIIKKKYSNKELKKMNFMIIGPSCVGKSTLINSMLKLDDDEKAFVNEVEIGTLIDKAYINKKKVPFLRIIDTRGIELQKQYGPKQILENTKNIIEMQNTKNKIKENKYNPTKNNYIDYIHCIWYCVSNKPIDQNEIGVIKLLKKSQDILPIIVVYTNSKNEELVKKAEQIIKTEFNDIPFISVLAEPIENVIESFGLDKLLDMTLEICKKSVKSEAFITIKEIICDEIQKIYNKK